MITWADFRAMLGLAWSGFMVLWSCGLVRLDRFLEMKPGNASW